MAKKADIAPLGAEFAADELAAVTSFDDALTLVVDKLGQGGVHLASDVIGDGFKLLDNKDLLIGVPMLLVSWDFNIGDHGEFVSARVVTQTNQKYVLNDGSTGIRDQLIAYSTKYNKRAGLLVQKGLRRSNYVYKNEKGEDVPATTYYLDVSA